MDRSKFLTHIVFDLETLGTKDSSVVLECSVLKYHLVEDADKSIVDILKDNTKKFKLNANEQISMGRYVDPNTLNWWKEQEESVRKAVLTPSKRDLSVNDFHSQLMAWTKDVGFDPGNGFAWQRGTMDIQLLDNLFNQCIPEYQYQINKPIYWHRVRDIRTAVDCSTAAVSNRMNGYVNDFQKKAEAIIPGFKKHDSLHDIASEVINMREAGIF